MMRFRRSSSVHRQGPPWAMSSWLPIPWLRRDGRERPQGRDRGNAPGLPTRGPRGSSLLRLNRDAGEDQGGTAGARPGTHPDLVSGHRGACLTSHRDSW
jgi:hypothetical protein